MSNGWLAMSTHRDSASGPSVYRGYGYGKTGKGLCSGWLTSGALGDATGSEPTCD